MGFWAFMFAVAAMCPVIMIVFGLYFTKNAPKKINRFFGYRTTASMKNKETWEFAHKYIGRLWLTLGSTLLLPSVVPMLMVIGRSEEWISTISLIISIVGMVALIATIIPAENALKKNFDKDGNRITPQ